MPFHSPGFLSLVIPDFGQSEVGLSGAFLTELQANGLWKQVRIYDRLEIEL